MSDKLNVINAMDDPAHRGLLEEMIARMRMALAPMLNEAESDDDFSLKQGMFISAGAMFAGFTVGHLIAVGKMKPQDKARATKIVTVAFRTAIKLGEHEAREAMLQQMPPQRTGMNVFRALVRFYTHFGAGFVAGGLVVAVFMDVATVSPAFAELAVATARAALQ